MFDTLAKCEWIMKGLPLSLLGGSEAGKSHLLITFGAVVALSGHRVNHVLATKLVNQLLEAAAESS